MSVFTELQEYRGQTTLLKWYTDVNIQEVYVFHLSYLLHYYR